MRARYEAESSSVHRYDSASFWDRRYHAERFARIATLLTASVQAGDRFLDVGCGTGEYLTVAIGQGAHVAVGVDVAFGYCGRASALEPRAAVAVADATSLPFSDGAFDVVLCSEVVEHLAQEVTRRAIDELARVTRRSLIVTTPNDRAAIRRIARRLAPGAVSRSDDEVGHVNLLDADELLDLVPPTFMYDAFHVWHITPPVVGEMLHLPAALEPLVDRTESAAQRVAPGSGNVMAISLVRRT